MPEAVTLVAQKSAVAEDSCKCLPWNEVYAKHSVTCGDGMELFHLDQAGGSSVLSMKQTKTIGNSNAGRAFCTDFFEAMTTNYCMNQKFLRTKEEATEWYGGSWCYVSAECKAAGTPVNEEVSLKNCQEGKDVLLSALTPAEIVAFSQENNLDATLAFGYAYTHFDESTKNAKEKVASIMKEYGVDTPNPTPITIWDTQTDDGMWQKHYVVHGTQHLALALSDAIYEGVPPLMISKGQWWRPICIESGDVATGCGGDPAYSSFWMDKEPAKLNAEQESCECLPWAELYKTKKVTCGQGLELTFMDGEIPDEKEIRPLNDPMVGVLKAHDAAISGEFCEGFFEKIKTNHCVNKKFRMGQEEVKQSYGGSWCYVSAKCKNLNGGVQVPGTDVSYKTCTAGQDRQLRDMEPRDLVQYGLAQDLEVSVVAGFGYGTVDEDAKTISSDRLKKIKDSVSDAGIPAFVISTSGKLQSSKLVSKDQVWSTQWIPSIVEGTVGKLQIRRRHHHITECEDGCSTVVP
jgi:hypothetical protein